MPDDDSLTFRFYSLVALFAFGGLLSLVVCCVIVERLSRLNRKLHRIESHVRRLTHIAETHFPIESESPKDETHES